MCSVGTNGLTVTFVGFGTCTLTPSVAQGANYFGATGNPQSFPVQEASHGYWLVGSDGGIFSFGTAAFHGSTGSTPLQRPVVAITPTSTGNGYWLVASDGGIFSFGDSTYYGSLPGVGLHPAGSGLPQSLNAPIVGMVPTFTVTATSWWPPTAASSRSATPSSRAPAPASAGVRARPSP